MTARPPPTAPPRASRILSVRERKAAQALATVASWSAALPLVAPRLLELLQPPNFNFFWRPQEETQISPATPARKLRRLSEATATLFSSGQGCTAPSSSVVAFRARLMAAHEHTVSVSALREAEFARARVQCPVYATADPVLGRPTATACLTEERETWRGTAKTGDCDGQDEQSPARLRQSLLTVLPVDMLLALWPLERILSGVQVCRLLRKELTKIAAIRPMLDHGLVRYMYNWTCSAYRCSAGAGCVEGKPAGLCRFCAPDPSQDAAIDVRRLYPDVPGSGCHQRICPGYCQCGNCVRRSIVSIASSLDYLATPLS